jgi:hypothetical protein
MSKLQSITNLITFLNSHFQFEHDYVIDMGIKTTITLPTAQFIINNMPEPEDGTKQDNYEYVFELIGEPTIWQMHNLEMPKFTIAGTFNKTQFIIQ